MSEAADTSGFRRARGPLWRWMVLAGILAGLAGVAAMLFLHRPQGQFFYPQCTFHVTTGLLCPGCGGLRSLHELLHGRIGSAVRCNALVILGPPLLGAWWWWLGARRGGSGPVFSARVVWVLALIALAFTVVRNLPWAPAIQWLVP